jgi:glycosyltransferase involved in cell wall biosynthesis
VPATYQEPKGLFLMEAMACVIPVVQPRVGAFPEIVQKTGGGLIVDADPGAIAAGLAALKRDPSLAESLGAAGAAGVREHYSVERMADHVEDVYRELAGVRA